MILLVAYAFTQILVTYSSISYFGWKIYQQFKRTTVNPKTQRIQKQITNILLVQAITPPL